MVAGLDAKTARNDAQAFAGHVSQCHMPLRARLEGAAAHYDLLVDGNADHIHCVQDIDRSLHPVGGGVRRRANASGALTAIAFSLMIGGSGYTPPFEFADQDIVRCCHGPFQALHGHREHLDLVRASLQFAAENEEFLVFHAERGLEQLYLAAWSRLIRVVP